MTEVAGHCKIQRSHSLDIQDPAKSSHVLGTLLVAIAKMANENRHGFTVFLEDSGVR